MPCAAVEIRDNPKTQRRKPVSIGRTLGKTGGVIRVVSTCSYEARAFWCPFSHEFQSESLASQAVFISVKRRTEKRRNLVCS